MSTETAYKPRHSYPQVHPAFAGAALLGSYYLVQYCNLLKFFFSFTGAASVALGAVLLFELVTHQKTGVDATLSHYIENAFVKSEEAVSCLSQVLPSARARTLQQVQNLGLDIPVYAFITSYVFYKLFTWMSFINVLYLTLSVALVRQHFREEIRQYSKVALNILKEQGVQAKEYVKEHGPKIDTTKYQPYIDKVYSFVKRDSPSQPEIDEVEEEPFTPSVVDDSALPSAPTTSIPDVVADTTEGIPLKTTSEPVGDEIRVQY